MRKQLAKGTKAYIVVSDMHVPFHDKRCFDAVCDFADDLRPDGIVFNGDILDLIELSTHAQGSLSALEGSRLAKSYVAGNAVLDTITAAAGKTCTDLRWIDGNHENRLDRWLAAGDNAVLSGLLDIPAALRFERRGIEYVGKYPNAYTKLGHLAVTHGQWTPKHHASKHLDSYRCAVLYGHTHSPQMCYASTLDGVTAAYGAGHLADTGSKAMQYRSKPNHWAQGFAVVFVRKTKEFNCQLIQFWGGKFEYGNKTYGGAR